MKLSFILPVYNVATYLRQCVCSITQQDYHDIEVILIDDASTDGSSDLCDQLAQEDSRIHVVHQTHGGLSHTRNSALQYVTGDYMMYVDSDDYLTCRDGKMKRVVEDILAAHCPDFVQLNYTFLFQDGTSSKYLPFDARLTSCRDRDAFIQYLVTQGLQIVNAWGKFLRVEFVRSSQLSFAEGWDCEDNLWFIELLDKAESFLFLNHYLYAYRKLRPGSITEQFGLTYCDSILYHLQHITNRIPQLRFRPESHQYILSFFAGIYCKCLMQLHKLPREERDVKHRELKAYAYLLDYDCYPTVRKVNAVRRFLGYELTVFLLQIYDAQVLSKRFAKQS